MVPFEEMPHALNPSEGIVVSCNNKPVSDSYPHDLGDLFANGFRARRVRDLLNGRRLSFDNCRQMQMDVVSLPAKEIVSRLRLLDVECEEREVWRLLETWDGTMAADSVAASIYAVFINHLAHLLLAPHLSPDLLYQVLGAGPHPILLPKTEFHGRFQLAVIEMLQNPNSSWLPGNRTARSAVVSQALRNGLADLRRRLGPDPHLWQWGRLHQVRFRHAMSNVALIGRVFNVGPFPLGGDSDTVAQSAGHPEDPYDTGSSGVSFRFVVDWGEQGRMGVVYAPGQSGQVGSRFHGNLTPAWLDGGLLQLPWKLEEITSAARHHLQLLPAQAQNQT
jgi:penicillin amidase